MRVLIVEDHAETRTLIARSLKLQGFEIVAVDGAELATIALEAGGVDAIILDWMLPGESGPALVRRLRASGDLTPVLMLTARGEVEDRVVGLSAGADDYLRKPFAMAELVARVRALLRRASAGVSEVTVGALHIDVAARRADVGGRVLPLTAREYSMTLLLARRPGAVVEREEFLELLWGDKSGSAGSSLDVLIGRLRRKLGAASARCAIETRRGVGYVMVEAE